MTLASFYIFPPNFSGCQCKYVPLSWEHFDMFFRCWDSYFYKCFNGTVAFKIPAKAMDWNSETCPFLHGKNHRLDETRVCGVRACCQDGSKTAWLQKTNKQTKKDQNQTPNCCL